MKTGPQTVALTELREWPDNPRKISDSALERLQASLKADPDLLAARPMIALPDGTVIAGNMRLRALRQMGVESAPVHVIDADERRAREIALRDNNQFGEWEDEPLAEMIATLIREGGEPMLLGFEGPDVDRLLSLMHRDDATRDPNDVPELPAEPTTKPGDLIEMGAHRLICGDAEDRDVLADACALKKANAVWTDPPYGVDYEGGTAEALRLRNDDLADKDLEKLVVAVLDASRDVTAPGGAIYLAHPATKALLFHRALLTAGWRHAQTLQWVKNAAVPGRQDYNWQHEPIFYGWNPAGGHRWFGDHARRTVLEEVPEQLGEMGPKELRALVRKLQGALGSDVVRADKPSRSAEHPTMKPVEIIEGMLRNSTERGHLVLDPFAGSGSTLIACERLGRRCALVEVDPRYCDVILARWEKLTGRKGERR